jgi:FdhE protein
VQQTFLKLSAVAEQHGVAAAAQIHAALNGRTFEMENLLVLLLSGDDRGLAALATGAQCDPPLFSVLAHFALRPTLFTFAEAYADRVMSLGRGWQRTLCPVCGGPPLLAEYRDIDQSRHLRCAHCATSWLYPRMQCAWCGGDDFRRLAQLTLEDDARYRVDLCAVCGRYLKGMLAEEPIPSDLLPLEDLLSLPLDAMARQAGYRQAETSAGASSSA